MRLSLSEHLSRAWQPLSHFLLVLESGGTAGGFEELHERLDVMNQRLARLEAGATELSKSTQPNSKPGGVSA
jgi:hypothetical protein